MDAGVTLKTLQREGWSVKGIQAVKKLSGHGQLFI